MIRHHPSETILLGCAAGNLSEPHARAVATHAAYCHACAGTLRDADEAAGALLDAMTPAPLASDAFARLSDRLDEPVSVQAEWDFGPVTLAAAAGRRWRWVAPGVALMRLNPRDHSNTRLDLIRVAPGKALVEHVHSGLETICVLQGSFTDRTNDYHVGDFAEADGSITHQPTALPGQHCICVLATTGFLRGRGPLGWLIRPMSGM